MKHNTAIRFVSKDRNLFFHTLNERINVYFQERNLSRNATYALVVKTIVLLTAYILPFILILILQPTFGWALLGWSIMGFAMAGVGMSIMHDANHGAYSSKAEINKLISFSINLVGGSMFNWQLQHNVLHHTFTNIVHYDEDIADKPMLRLSPHTEVKKAHRLQWLFAVLIYGLVTLYWVTAKDFLQFNRYTRNGVSKGTPAQHRLILTKIIVLKVVYFFVFLGLPVLLGMAFWPVLAGFLVMHFIGGVVLTVIFQLAHTVEETTFPRPNAEGNIENDWAIHQMNTTVNFCRNNRLLSWYVGGLNFQVEHHLFPRISHVHYPRLASIVQRTAEEFNVPYLEHRSFGKALQSHFATLRQFGRLPDLDEAIG